MQITLWLLVCLLVMGFYEFVVARYGADPVRNFYSCSMYFLACSAACLFTFKREIILLVPGISAAALVWLALFFAVKVLVHFWVAKNFNAPVEFISRNPNLRIVLLDWRYVISNSSSVLFQQVLFVAGVAVLRQHGYSTIATIAIFATLSFAGHALLIFKLGPRWGWYFSLFSAAAAIVYPLLILYVKDGAVYSFMVQSAFYTFSAVGIWLYHQGVPKVAPALEHLLSGVESDVAEH